MKKKTAKKNLLSRNSNARSQWKVSLSFFMIRVDFITVEVYFLKLMHPHWWDEIMHDDFGSFGTCFSFRGRENLGDFQACCFTTPRRAENILFWLVPVAAREKKIQLKNISWADFWRQKSPMQWLLSFFIDANVRVEFEQLAKPVVEQPGTNNSQTKTTRREKSSGTQGASHAECECTPQQQQWSYWPYNHARCTSRFFSFQNDF